MLVVLSKLDRNVSYVPPLRAVWHLQENVCQMLAQFQMASHENISSNIIQIEQVIFRKIFIYANVYMHETMINEK